MVRRLTASDVCAVTGYSRDELHALLRVLGPYNVDRPSPRVAREFTGKDLLVLSVAQVLENRFGVRRNALPEIGELLQRAFGGPRSGAEISNLVITINPPQVLMAEEPVNMSGMLVPLAPIYDAVDAYLSYDPQLSLRFGPALVRQRYG